MKEHYCAWRQAFEWNQQHAIGERVRYWTGVREGRNRTLKKT